MYKDAIALVEIVKITLTALEWCLYAGGNRPNNIYMLGWSESTVQVQVLKQGKQVTYGHAVCWLAKYPIPKAVLNKAPSDTLRLPILPEPVVVLLPPRVLSQGSASEEQQCRLWLRR